RVHAVRQGDDAGRRDAPRLAELAGERGGRGEDPRGAADDGPLEAARGARHRAGRGEGPVVGQLAGQAALEIGDERTPSPAGEGGSDDRAFVQMTVDDVGPEAAGRAEGGHEEEEVQVRLVRG